MFVTPFSTINLAWGVGWFRVQGLWVLGFSGLGFRGFGARVCGFRAVWELRGLGIRLRD